MSAPSQNRTCAVNASGSQLPLVYRQQSGCHCSSSGYQISESFGTGQRIALQISTKGSQADAAFLAATTYPAVSESLRSFLVFDQTRPIVIDAVVLIMTSKLAVQCRPDFADRLCQIVTQPFFQLGKLATQLLTGCFPLQLESAQAAMAEIQR